MIKLFYGSDEVPINVLRFSGGEMQVKVSSILIHSEHRECRIKAHIKNSDDIMTLLLLTDAVRRDWGADMQIVLIMPYIPYARQDRVCAKGEALSLKVFCDLINSQNYDYVEVHDPHSDVATALLNNCDIVQQYEFLINIQAHLDIDNTVLVSPDAGASKKTLKVAQYCDFQTVYQADKVRSVMTGEITGTVVHGDHIGDNDFLIVDDICDGGRTFIELAKKLKELTDGNIYLYTTHAILSKGLFPLLKDIKHLYTANPWCDNVNEDYITILNY